MSCEKLRRFFGTLASMTLGYIIAMAVILSAIITWEGCAGRPAFGQDPGHEYQPRAQLDHLPGPRPIEELRTWGEPPALTVALVVNPDAAPWTTAGRLGTGTIFRRSADPRDLWQRLDPPNGQLSPWDQGRPERFPLASPLARDLKWVYAAKVPEGIVVTLSAGDVVRPVESARIQVRIAGVTE